MQELERIEQLLRAENADEDEEGEEEEEEQDDEGEIEECEVDEEVQQALAIAHAHAQMNHSDSFERHVRHSGDGEADLSGMRGHSLMDNSGASEGGLFAYGNGAVPGLYAHSGSVDSADDLDLQRALSQSLMDPYGGPGEDSSGYEEDGIMYASLEESPGGPPATPRRL